MHNSICLHNDKGKTKPPFYPSIPLIYPFNFWTNEITKDILYTHACPLPSTLTRSLLAVNRFLFYKNRISSKNLLYDQHLPLRLRHKWREILKSSAQLTLVYCFQYAHTQLGPWICYESCFYELNMANQPLLYSLLNLVTNVWLKCSISLPTYSN